MGEDFRTQINDLSDKARESVAKRSISNKVRQGEAEAAVRKQQAIQEAARLMLPDIAEVMRDDAFEAAERLQGLPFDVSIGVYRKYRRPIQLPFEGYDRYQDRLVAAGNTPPFRTTGLWVVNATFDRTFIGDDEHPGPPTASFFNVAAIDKEGTVCKYGAKVFRATQQFTKRDLAEDSERRREIDVIERATDSDLVKRVDISISDPEGQPCVIKWRENILNIFKRIEDPTFNHNLVSNDINLK